MKINIFSKKKRIINKKKKKKKKKKVRTFYINLTGNSIKNYQALNRLYNLDLKTFVWIQIELYWA